MKPSVFVETIAPAAVASAALSKVPASFTIAQAALESGWGAHCPGNNLFGIKADASWTGPSTRQDTREVINGESVMIRANFRSYPDWQGCMDDRAKFLQGNKRYAKAFSAKDGQEFARAIAAAGYATDPDYADKLVSIMERHNLARFDPVAKA